MTLKLVSFDLDGTLIHPAVFNVVADALGFGEKLEETTRLYFAGKMTADETFHADYKHFVGRDVGAMHEALRASDRWTPGIAEAVDELHARSILVAVTTDQPDWLAGLTKELFDVDLVVCSHGDVRHGRVAGSYQLEHDKWANLARHLRAKRIDPQQAAHVGNGRNDIPVFRNVGRSLAVWPMHEDVAKAATSAIPEPTSALQMVAALVDS